MDSQSHQLHGHSSIPRHHHHHHHFHVSPHCPFHSFMLHLRNHSPTCPVFASSFPQSQNPETLPSVLLPKDPLDSQFKETIFDSTVRVMQQEKAVEMEEEREQQEEEEEEEDPVFVLTDEWREFFAKSESKRRLAKKQARKKVKNRTEQ